MIKRTKTRETEKGRKGEREKGRKEERRKGGKEERDRRMRKDEIPLFVSV